MALYSNKKLLSAYCMPSISLGMLLIFDLWAFYIFIGKSGPLRGTILILSFIYVYYPCLHISL